MVRDSNKHPPWGGAFIRGRCLKEGSVYFIFSTTWGGLYWREAFKRRGRLLEDLRYLLEGDTRAVRLTSAKG